MNLPDVLTHQMSLALHLSLGNPLLLLSQRDLVTREDQLDPESDEVIKMIKSTRCVKIAVEIIMNIYQSFTSL